MITLLLRLKRWWYLPTTEEEARVRRLENAFAKYTSLKKAIKIVKDLEKNSLVMI